MFWHCFSNLCVNSNESVTMCGIKDKVGSIIQCKISDILLVWKTGEQLQLVDLLLKYFYLFEYSLYVSFL